MLVVTLQTETITDYLPTNGNQEGESKDLPNKTHGPQKMFKSFIDSYVSEKKKLHTHSSQERLEVAQDPKEFNINIIPQSHLSNFKHMRQHQNNL